MGGSFLLCHSVERFRAFPHYVFQVKQACLHSPRALFLWRRWRGLLVSSWKEPIVCLDKVAECPPHFCRGSSQGESSPVFPERSGGQSAPFFLRTKSFPFYKDPSRVLPIVLWKDCYVLMWQEPKGKEPIFSPERSQDSLPHFWKEPGSVLLTKVPFVDRVQENGPQCFSGKRGEEPPAFLEGTIGSLPHSFARKNGGKLFPIFLVRSGGESPSL